MTSFPPWGDGFADDGVFDFARVDDWDRCSDDEAVMLFPSLVRPDRTVHPRVVEMMLARSYASTTQRPGWFASLGGAGPSLRRHLVTVTIGAALDRVSSSGTADLPSDVDRALFAFASGIHPAYVDPDASACEARHTAAGWLGVIHRGRSALMPLAVAEYLSSCLAPDGQDDVMVVLAGGRRCSDALASVVSARLDGWNGTVKAPRFSRHAARDADRLALLAA